MRKSRKTQNPACGEWTNTWNLIFCRSFCLRARTHWRRNLSRSPLRSQCVQKGNSAQREQEQQTQENKLGTFISLSLSDNKFASVLLSSSSRSLRSQCMGLIIKKSSNGVPCVAIQYFPPAAARFLHARILKANSSARRLFALNAPPWYYFHQRRRWCFDPLLTRQSTRWYKSTRWE